MSSLEESLQTLKFDDGMGKMVTFPLLGHKELDPERLTQYLHMYNVPCLRFYVPRAGLLFTLVLVASPNWEACLQLW